MTGTTNSPRLTGTSTVESKEGARLKVERVHLTAAGTAILSSNLSRGIGSDQSRPPTPTEPGRKGA